MAAFLRALKRPAVELAEIRIDGEAVPLKLKRHARARRMILRLDRDGGGAIVTIPVRASRRRALEFAITHSNWILQRLSALPEKVYCREGSIIPLRGKPHLIRQSRTARGTVRVIPETRNALARIEVAGEPPHFSRRLLEWLKAECKKDLAAASTAYAEAMGVAFHKISVRDQTSRWGSCSTTGQLSYSWRLILAPPFVLDYVAAHEVAHLKHMNHGPKFWALVGRYCTDFQRARSWMRRHGKELHAYVV